MKKYYHELTKSKRKAILNGDHTWKWLIQNYKKPDWCRCPDALSPLGCAGLISESSVNEKYCKRCGVNTKNNCPTCNNLNNVSTMYSGADSKGVCKYLHMKCYNCGLEFNKEA